VRLDWGVLVYTVIRSFPLHHTAVYQDNLGEPLPEEIHALTSYRLRI